MIIQRILIIALILAFLGTSVNLILELMEVDSQFVEFTYSMKKFERIEEKLPSSSFESSNIPTLSNKEEEGVANEKEISQRTEEKDIANICKGELSRIPLPQESNYFYKLYSEHAKRLEEKNLCSSLNHHNKFFTVKDRTLAWLKKEKQSLLYEKGRQFYAISVNERYAVRHIFKNAGSTIMELMGKEHIKYEEYGHYFRRDDGDGKHQTLIAIIRDPIDHFMSGWAECGARSSDPETDLSFASTIETNSRIQHWLNFAKNCIAEEMGTEFRERRERPSECFCMVHSMPQVNYLLNHNDKGDVPMTFVDRNLGLIGDMSELYGVLEVAGYIHERKTLPWLRRSADMDSKSSFPQDRDLLSDETIEKICEFVMIDYYFFDFEPPAVCRTQIELDMQMISRIPLGIVKE